MILHPAKPLFDWKFLEDSLSLQTIKDLLATLPDGQLLDSLRRAWARVASTTSSLSFGVA